MFLRLSFEFSKTMWLFVNNDVFFRSRKGGNWSADVGHCSVCPLVDPIDLLHHFGGAVKQTCQIVLCVHDNLWEFWSPSFLSSVTYFSTFASRQQSLTIGIEKSLISNFILTDLKDINVRFFCSRFWELVVTRYTDVSLGVFYCASFVPNPVVNSFSRRVVEQDYSIVLQVFKNHMSLFYTSDFFFANCFLCSCYLNTTDDTCSWEKFEIQRFSFFQREENSKLIPLTLLVISCELLRSFWSLVFLFGWLPPFILWMDFPEAAN